MDKLTLYKFAVNKSLNKLIDKVYAFNTWVQNNNKNGKIEMDSVDYKMLKKIISEIDGADREYKRNFDKYKKAYN